ncbi:MAG: HAMP domain-containing sensor histidine kinase [Myxococcota bacterium]
MGSRLDLRDPILRRLEVVFLIATTASMLVSLVLGVEAWRAVIYIGASVLGLALPIQMRRETGRLSLRALLFLVASGLFTTLVCTGGLQAPWLVLLVALTAGAAGTLEPKDARVVLLMAFVALALSALVALWPIGPLDTLPAAYDRTVEGAGRWHASLNFLASVFASLIPGGAVARLTMRETARAVHRESQAEAQTVASVAARSQLVSRMTAALAHELAAPIAQTQARLERLLLRSSGVDAERLQVLAQETERLAQLVGGAPAPCTSPRSDVVALAREVISGHSALAAGRGVSLALAGGALAVAADEQALRQVLVNLVQNALEASPSGAEVVITVADGAVHVDDRGAGLSADARLFESGYTTKAGGSGIGLVVARSLAERMHARLTLTNRDGGGCRATLAFLPAESP